VYDEASATTAERSKQPGWTSVTESLYPGPVTAAVRQAPVLVDFAGKLPPLRVTPLFSAGSQGELSRSRGMPSGGTLFMHELRNKPGHRRLAVVQRVPSNVPFIYPLGLQVALYEPATFWSPAKDASLPPLAVRGSRLSGLIPLVPIQPLRFYAGQLDPNDPAHFTIKYELAGAAGMVDGRLNETGDDIVLQVVSGPAMPPAPWSSWGMPQ
jgi:hypothetical protein